jgi:AhpD family alkylhydroperoxidase
MKAKFSSYIRNAALLAAFTIISLQMSAQSPSAGAPAAGGKTYEQTKQEITSMFGFFPLIFQAYPSYDLPGAWENFKQLGDPNNKIPPKYRELIQLAVAAQIPCIYCVYFHTASAKAFGASDDEIKEAIAQGANTRQWSMILQGNQVDYVAFQKEVQMMLKKMQEQQVKK